MGSDIFKSANDLLKGNVWLDALFGLEKESIRVDKSGKLAQTPHPTIFGNKLKHPYITTDFSESQIEMQKQNVCKISIYTLLEDEVTDTDRANGLDIADFIIAELKSKKTALEIQSFFGPTLQYMIDKNKALLVLINGLKLEEV